MTINRSFNKSQKHFSSGRIVSSCKNYRHSENSNVQGQRCVVIDQEGCGQQHVLIIPYLYFTLSSVSCISSWLNSESGSYATKYNRVIITVADWAGDDMNNRPIVVNGHNGVEYYICICTQHMLR
jgi:hypothetical protein